MNNENQSTIRIEQPEGPHTPVRVQQPPLPQVGRPQTTEEDQQYDDEEHIKALRGQGEVIRQLVCHQLSSRQLQSLYSGVGRYGLDRFLRENDDSILARVYVEFYDERIVDSLTLTAGGDPLQPAIPQER